MVGLRHSVSCFVRHIIALHCGLVAIMTSEALALSGGVLYVHAAAAGGANDGSSWCNAYVRLQDALAAASASNGSITEIRVGSGFYRPDEGEGQTPLDRSSTFRLLNGVAIKGGYAGCGIPNPDTRNVAVHLTILTGDLAGNDVGDRFHIPSHADNAYHVVTCNGTNETAVLDGVLVMSGRADGAFPNNSGAGLYNDGGRCTINDCTFTQNYATYYGGAIYNRNNGNPTFTNCRIVDNSGDYGGGMNNDSQSHATLTSCELSRNSVGYHGGGMYIANGARATLTHVTVWDNRSYYNGGGIAVNSINQTRCTDCNITENRSTNGAGGGAYIESGQVYFESCDFEGNTAALSGGGLASAGSTWLTHCQFTGNRAANGGGLIHFSGQIEPSNLIFERNEATLDGGAVYKLAGSGGMYMENCTIVRNKAGRYGGGIYNGASFFGLFNSILWKNADAAGTNAAAQIYGAPPVFLGFNSIQGLPLQPNADFNFGANPRFTPGPAGCYYLSQVDAGQLYESPCVDAGFSVADDTPVTGLTTRTDGWPDMAATDLGFHYPPVGGKCPLTRLDCYGRVTLLDFATFQNCFDANGVPSMLPCCGVYELGDVPGISHEDFAVWQAALSDPD
jgi:predicted outer membrane repeat protein